MGLSSSCHNGRFCLACPDSRNNRETIETHNRSFAQSRGKVKAASQKKRRISKKEKTIRSRTFASRPQAMVTKKGEPCGSPKKRWAGASGPPSHSLVSPRSALPSLLPSGVCGASGLSYVTVEYYRRSSSIVHGFPVLSPRYCIQFRGSLLH